MQKQQLVKWITNIIKTKVMQNQEQVLYELEAKIGKFKGLNYQSNRYLDSIKGMEQLDKMDKKYQFESKIHLDQYSNALEYLKSKSNPVELKRVDFSLNKQQRSSYQICNSQVSAILIEKMKNLTQHVDIINDKVHFRISLNQERTLSTSIKDILAQMPSRKQHANFIRLKETMTVREDNLEYALSRVLPISKQDPQFQNIIQIISDARCFNIKEKVDSIFKDAHFKEYEFEIEVSQNLKLEDQEIEHLSTELLNKIDHFWKIFNQKEEENEEQVQKKVKINEDA